MVLGFEEVDILSAVIEIYCTFDTNQSNSSIFSLTPKFTNENKPSDMMWCMSMLRMQERGKARKPTKEVWVVEVWVYVRVKGKSKSPLKWKKMSWVGVRYISTLLLLRTN